MTELPRAELADQRPSPPVRQALRLVLNTGVQVMAALLAIVLGLSIHLLHRQQIYTAHATARVLDYERKGPGIRTYHVDVAYRDAAGTEHTGGIFVRGDLATSYTVDYDPEHPEHVIWHEPWYTNVAFGITLFGFGSLALGGVAIAMWAGVQKLRRRDSIRTGAVLPRLLLPALSLALLVWLVQILTRSAS
ncbi:MAG TPA: DUF3592 domain-containing protein [Kofleriaceae bacterium]|nr:DUF3592 domain-containing protein [Kofleriaceae bacterium]